MLHLKSSLNSWVRRISSLAGDFDRPVKNFVLRTTTNENNLCIFIVCINLFFFLGTPNQRTVLRHAGLSLHYYIRAAHGLAKGKQIC